MSHLSKQGQLLHHFHPTGQATKPTTVIQSVKDYSLQALRISHDLKSFFLSQLIHTRQTAPALVEESLPIQMMQC